MRQRLAMATWQRLLRRLTQSILADSQDGSNKRKMSYTAISRVNRTLRESAKEWPRPSRSSPCRAFSCWTFRDRWMCSPRRTAHGGWREGRTRSRTGARREGPGARGSLGASPDNWSCSQVSLQGRKRMTTRLSSIGFRKAGFMRAGAPAQLRPAGNRRQDFLGAAYIRGRYLRV
jgi:hypothetical protein